MRIPTASFLRRASPSPKEGEEEVNVKVDGEPLEPGERGEPGEPGEPDEPCEPEKLCCKSIHTVLDTSKSA